MDGMDFFTALKEAKLNGISQDEFARIWELELKLKQQKEESRILELKLAHAESQDIIQYQSIMSQVTDVLQDHVKDLQKQISQLKNDLTQQSCNQIQKISEQFESQAVVTALVIKNEVENILVQYATGAKSGGIQNEPSVLDGFQKPLTGKKENNSQKILDDTQQQANTHQDKVQQNAEHQTVISDPEGNVEMLFPSEEGALLGVKDVDQLITGTIVTESSVYILPDCPSKVQLSVWFNNVGNISARLSISGVKGQFLKSPKMFTVTGFIVNKNSGSYSPLFEGVSQPLRKLRPNKEMQVNTTTCLKTSKCSFENVNYEELEKRNFVVNNSLIIKWFVTTDEVQPDSA